MLEAILKYKWYLAALGLLIAINLGFRWYEHHLVESGKEIANKENDLKNTKAENEIIHQDFGTRIKQNEVLNSDVTPNDLNDILRGGSF